MTMLRGAAYLSTGEGVVGLGRVRRGLGPRGSGFDQPTVLTTSTLAAACSGPYMMRPASSSRQSPKGCIAARRSTRT